MSDQMTERRNLHEKISTLQTELTGLHEQLAMQDGVNESVRALLERLTEILTDLETRVDALEAFVSTL